MLRKIILMLTVGLLLATPAFAKEAPERTTVQVSGTSQMEVVPDIACIDVSITSINLDLEQAKSDNVQKANNVLDKLKEQGINEEQIKTDTYNIEPLYNYEKDSLPKLKGYQVVNRLSIKAPIEKVGLLVDGLTSAGANEINSIRFEKANETEARAEALKDAVEDAIKKANIIASALNMKIANVKSVNESGVYYHPVLMDYRGKAANMAMATPNIPSGKISVGANVQVIVELE